MEFDLIIPTYRPGDEFVALLRMIGIQKLSPKNVYIINTEERYWKKEFENIIPLKVIHIKKSEFDHGGTRGMAVSLSKMPYFICMTQDARPKTDDLFINLLEPFADEMVAISYARQEVDDLADEIERYTREFNYPEMEIVKTSDSIKELGIKALFSSDVCAAYKRESYDRVGGFVKRTIFNEDMLIAYEMLRAGYKVVYNSRATVIHYHSYSVVQDFRRSFDLGVSHREYREVFGGVSSYKEGGRLVNNLVKHLIRTRKIYLIPKFIIHTVARLIGYRLGKSYDRLPRWLVKRFSMNKEYFK